MYLGSDRRRTALAVCVAITCVALMHAAARDSRAQPAVPLPPPAAAPMPLRVCADPNNLPYSDRQERGFENAIARLLAADLGRPLAYYWQPQRRGFLRTTIQAKYCDVVMSVPPGLPRVRATRPYYRSTYVFVTRRDRRLDVKSFDDRRLANAQIAIQITGEDYENPPPAQALAVRQLVDHIHGYTVYGDYSQASPQRAIVDAVAAGEVDIAVVWGPLAGYFAGREPVPLRLEPVAPDPVRDQLPFAFDIAVAVRRDDGALGDALDAALARHRREITRILQRFGVPLVAATGT